MASHPPIRARSLPEANLDLVSLAPATGVVSIGEPGTPEPYGFRPGDPFHLRLEFHDLDEAIEGFVAPGREHVIALLERAVIFRAAREIYCHCNAGISRSTAAAYILRCHWLGPGSEGEAMEAVLRDRPQARPSRRWVELADEHLGREGAMLEALEAQ